MNGAVKGIADALIILYCYTTVLPQHAALMHTTQGVLQLHRQTAMPSCTTMKNLCAKHCTLHIGGAFTLQPMQCAHVVQSYCTTAQAPLGHLYCCSQGLLACYIHCERLTQYHHGKSQNALLLDCNMLPFKISPDIGTPHATCCMMASKP